MAACKLKRGDRIYECRCREATLLELITDPELRVQGSGSHYWHWKAKVVETNSHYVAPGEIVEFGITEEAPQYGPQLFRKNVYEVGIENAEPVLPPFDTSKSETVDKTSYEDMEFMNAFEKKALEFLSVKNIIVKNKSRENLEAIFFVLDSLSLRPGYRLGLKLAGEVGIGDESWFYTYQGQDPIDTFGCRVPKSSTLFEGITVEQTVMGAWQAYLFYISPTILPKFWHGGYIAREYFFDRDHFIGVTSNWTRGVNLSISQIPQPTVVMKAGTAVVSCPYWNDWKGLVLESVKVNYNSDGTVSLTPYEKVLYEYDCGICY